MRSSEWVRKLLPSAIGIAAALAACASSTASGGSSASGSGTAMAARAGGATDGGGIAHDVAEGAGTAAGNVASGVHSAVQGIADAGGAAHGAAAGAATTAAEAARNAAANPSTSGPAADGGAPETPEASDAGTAGISGGAALNDARIGAIAMAANAVDIAAARSARKKTKNSRVRRFANEMIRGHTSANAEAAALAKKLGITPEENDTSRKIEQDGKDNLANLAKVKGKDFDRTYADHEVAYHQAILEALDQKLIPGAQNAELKSLLQSMRAAVAEHLDHAASLANSLSK